MELPKFNETFQPILSILHDGKVMSARELYKRVEEQFYSSLPNELLKITTKSGDRLIENRIAWGKSYLKKGGFVIFPQRGLVQITDKGKNAKKEEISIDVMNADALKFYDTNNSEIGNITNVEASPQDLIEKGITQIEHSIKSDLLDKIKQMDPYLFEKTVLILLNKMGYGEYIETSKSRDGGIDGIINEDQLGIERIYIQSKRYNEGKVRELDIRNFIGAMSGDTTKGIFVTTSSFDDHAIRKAKEAHHKIILVDGKKLVDLLFKFDVGVQIKSTYVIKSIDNDFFDNEEI